VPKHFGFTVENVEARVLSLLA